MAVTEPCPVYATVPMAHVEATILAFTSEVFIKQVLFVATQFSLRSVAA
jgi:hypothetical protein